MRLQSTIRAQEETAVTGEGEGGNQVTIDRRKYSEPIRKRSKAKPQNFQISFATQLKISPLSFPLILNC